MRFPWIRAFRVSVPVEELAAAERQNAAAQAENVRLLKALTAADRSADMLAAELTSSMTEVADLREALATARLQNRALRNQISESRYAAKLCPGCGQAADEDGPDTDVLATDPTRQEPNE